MVCVFDNARRRSIFGKLPAMALALILLGGIAAAQEAKSMTTPSKLDDSFRIRLFVNGLRPYCWAVFGDEQRCSLRERMKFYRVPGVRESKLNRLGYQLLQQGRTVAAIAVFQLSAEWYPQSANAFDSLGEAFLEAGELDKAERTLEGRWG